MKRMVFIAGAFALIGLTAGAQNSATVQMQCRKLAEGGNNYLGPNETIINGMACHTVAQEAPAVAPVETPKPREQAPSILPSATVPSGPVSTKITSGARVYVEPMDGFGTYLVAAIQKKKVQLIPVANVEQADYVISGTSEEKKAGWAKIVFAGNIHSDDSASVSMADRRTGAIMFAYAVNKKSTLHGNQTTAEACAKHLEAHIQGKE